MGAGILNLLKMCVGAEQVSDLTRWQARQAAMQAAAGRPVEHTHTTRMWPRREAELLDGGSMYWVFKGVILARQRIARLDRVTGEDGVSRCAIVLHREVIKTEVMPRRPFQGWRYLRGADAPGDLSAAGRQDDDLPAGLSVALADIGLR